MELVQMQKSLQDYTKSLFLEVSFCYTHVLLEIEFEGWRKCFRNYTKTGVYG